MAPDDAVRAYFAADTEGDPDRFDRVVSPDYVDYGHTPPGHGPDGARDDYEHAVQVAGGVITYDIDALIAREDTVAVAWTGHMPSGAEFRGPEPVSGERRKDLRDPPRRDRRTAELRLSSAPAGDLDQ